MSSRTEAAIRLLVVEDSEDDTKLALRGLRRAGFALEHERVESAEGLRAALARGGWDAVLSDYKMPGFTGLQALEMVKGAGLDIPFILVSGTIGQELAVAAMKAGASDYVMKDRIGRLAPSLERELKEARARAEHRRTQARLAESEERYRDLVEHSHDLICTHDLEGKLLSVNEAAARITGRSREALPGTNLGELLDPAVRREFPAYLAEIGSKGAASGVMCIRTAAGEPRWLEYRNSLRTEGVAAPVVRGTAQDVTERRRAELELRESEARFRSLTSMSSDFYWETDAEHRLTLRGAGSKPSPVEDFRRSAQIGKRRWEVPYLSPGEAGWRAHRAALDAREPFRDFEISRLGTDGTERFISLSGDPVFDAGGGFTGYRGVGTDITDRKQREARHLREQEALIALTGAEAAADESIDATLRRITETSARTVGVSRVSIWRYRADRGSIRSVDLYDAAAGSRADGLELSRADYPAYFKALEEMDVIAADDAHRDPRTCEFSASYLTPLGIGAMLDAPIRVGGRGYGVLCHEHIGPPRQWESDEKTFAVAAANLVSLALERAEREQSQAALRGAFAQIERLNRVRAMLAAVGSAIVHIRERDALYAEACRIATEHGGFSIAWISHCDSEAGEVAPAAWSGIADGIMATAGHRLAADVSGGEHSGITRTVLRERRTVVHNELRAHPAGGPVRGEALRRGCRSGIGLPIKVDGEIEAVLILFADEMGFFNDEEVRLLEGMAADLSLALEHMAKSERLAYLARNDELTGLPNRAALLERMAQQLPAVSRAGSRSALVLLDIDRFQAVNDSYGRAGGDELLRQVAARLRGALRGSDAVARLGPDRFAALALDMQKEGDIAGLLHDKILGPLNRAFRVAGHELHVIARAGVTLYPADGTDAEALLGNAEAALKRAKSETERYVFYAPEINARVAERLALATRLRGALERREFVLHYQPKLRLADGALCGVEALIRWQDPEKGLVAPGAFIPLLEETGLIVEVGQWALAEALAQHRRWAAAGCAAGRVAVNVSALQLRQKDFVGSVMDTVARAGDAGEALEIEITESLLMQDFDATVRKLSLLREGGVKVAMDDFGTGFCSLNYLARLPIDSVKIDRSFVTHIATDERGAAIVASVISLARSLKLQTVAEGVETAEQAAALARLGCDEAQGYLYSRPVPARDIEARYARAAL